MRMSDTKIKSAVAKKIKRRKGILIFFAVLILAAVSLFTPAFNVSEIKVNGNSIVSDKEIIKASKIKNTDNVFRLSSSKAEKHVKKIGYIDTVRVVKKFPARVVIEVTESDEIAYVTFSGNYVGLRKDGKVTSITKSSKMKPKKAVVSGFGVKEAKVAGTIIGKKQEKTELLIQLLEALSDNELASSVKKIDISDLKEVYIILSTDTKVILGDIQQIDYKMKCLNTVLEELGEIRGGKINLTDPVDIIYEGGN